MSSTKRILLATTALVIPFLVSGCYDRADRGGQSVYQFAAWVGAAVIGVGLLLAVGGVVLIILKQRWGFLLPLFAAFLLIIVAPSMYTDFVVVDADHFEASYGFWFTPSVHNIKFAQLRELRHVAVRDNKNRIKYEMHCKYMNGTVTVVHCGDLVKNAVPEILSKARAKGVSVHSDGL